jgi:hypothetical protein
MTWVCYCSGFIGAETKGIEGLRNLAQCLQILSNGKKKS